jgi:dihydrofolate reductase
LAQVPESETEKLHAMGPTGITALRDALDDRVLAFRNERGRRFQMASLIYSAIASLDGFVEDEQGEFDWAAPDEEVHAFVNDLERPVGTYLYGRRLYETMVYWETVSTGGDQAAVTRDFAEIWRAAEKVVYSRTLQTVSSERTRIEREFDAAAIKQLKERSRSDITIGGAELAGQAIAEGLVDECHLFLGPVLVGGGKRALPADVYAELELLDERRFRSGVVYLHYRL